MKMSDFLQSVQKFHQFRLHLDYLKLPWQAGLFRCLMRSPQWWLAQAWLSPRLHMWRLRQCYIAQMQYRKAFRQGTPTGSLSHYCKRNSENSRLRNVEKNVRSAYHCIIEKVGLRLHGCGSSITPLLGQGFSGFFVVVVAVSKQSASNSGRHVRLKMSNSCWAEQCCRNGVPSMQMKYLVQSSEIT